MLQNLHFLLKVKEESSRFLEGYVCISSRGPPLPLDLELYSRAAQNILFSRSERYIRGGGGEDEPDTPDDERAARHRPATSLRYVRRRMNYSFFRMNNLFDEKLRLETCAKECIV